MTKVTCGAEAVLTDTVFYKEVEHMLSAVLETLSQNNTSDAHLS